MPERGKTLADRDARDEARDVLASACEAAGWPRELADLLASQLRSEKAMSRMAAYMRGVRPTSMEEIADEMLAIIEERDRWVERKISEHANAKITEYYNRPREDDGDDLATE